MNALKILGLLACAACGTAWAPAADAGSAASPLRAALKARERYVLGEPAPVEFTLENRSSKPVSVLTWNTPLDGLGSDSLRVRRDGVEVHYRGRLAKRGDPRREDYVRLEPGRSVTGSLDLAAAYDLSQPGHYEAWFAGAILDVVVDTERPPRPLGGMHGTTAPAGPVAFEVVHP